MSALLAGGTLRHLVGEAARTALEGVADALAADCLVPYLGPGLLEIEGPAAVPVLPEQVARELYRRSPTPSRIRTNMWAVAQYIESRRHRKTLRAFMADIFDQPRRPTALHRALAARSLTMIVDSWYDGTMRAALLEAGRRDFVDLQGVSRAAIAAEDWFEAYGPDGRPAPAEAPLVLYSPHGGILPSGNVLVADSDYVEVLTEIDIQTPIPAIVRDRRATVGFLFLGCRFHDQMLRTYARQIIKRSAGPHYAVAAADGLTVNERKFLAAEAITLIDLPLAEAAARLAVL